MSLNTYDATTKERILHAGSMNPALRLSTWMGRCTSSASTKDKIVTVDSEFKLQKGVRIGVKFDNSNTYNETSDNRITLNVNNTGAKSIYYAQGNTQGTSSKAFGLVNNYIYYVYNGEQWVWDGMNRDYDTTYSSMSVDELKTGTATSTRTVRADYLNTAINEMIDAKVGSLINATY